VSAILLIYLIIEFGKYSDLFVGGIAQNSKVKGDLNVY